MLDMMCVEEKDNIKMHGFPKKNAHIVNKKNNNK